MRALVLLTIWLFAGAASAQEEPDPATFLRVDSFQEGAEVFFQGGFAAGEGAAVRLDAEAYPVQVTSIWLLFGGEGVFGPREVTLFVWGDDGGLPGEPLYELTAQLDASSSNDHLVPLEDGPVVTGGPFWVGAILPHAGLPSLARDGDGIDADANALFSGSWALSSNFGLQGDWVIRADVIPADAPTPTPTASATPTDSPTPSPTAEPTASTTPQASSDDGGGCQQSPTVPLLLPLLLLAFARRWRCLFAALLLSGCVTSQSSRRADAPPERISLNLAAGAPCTEVKDGDELLARLCPKKTDAGLDLIIEAPGATHAYGLGEAFIEAGEPNGDWIGHVRDPGNEFGNRMTGFMGGAVGNLQIPVLQVLGKDGARFALMLDTVEPLTWDLTGERWVVGPMAAPIRGHVFVAVSPLALRQQILEVAGRPLVPPKAAFGLWVSEYGFDGWAELDHKLAGLQAAKIPVDGFVLDLQWFGGIEGHSDDTRMGSLDWDRAAFPEPEAKIAELRKRYGINIVVIEEPFIGKNTDTHAALAEKGFLVRNESAKGEPVYLTSNPWWGKGGMVDYTNPAANAWLHENRRKALVEDGVLGHWTDLGEPELFDEAGWYHGAEAGAHDHAANHNRYNLAWSRGIYEAYQKHHPDKRPFILSRSGALESQRYGVSLWSGDIASNLESLASHLRVQMHMSFSGVDYFGSDVGGFKRQMVMGDEDVMYTQWLAASAMLDVPLRPHTENLCNCRETSPHAVGKLSSNRAILQLRYALVPYLYSLAHRAHRYGEPMFAPAAFHFPADPGSQGLGLVKLVGPDLLFAAVAEQGLEQAEIYLPPATWFEWYGGTKVESKGQKVTSPLYVNGALRLPLYAREGAIVPMAYVDEMTRNSQGWRADDSTRDELIIRAFPGPELSRRVFYEDDGVTTAYLKGAVRETPVEIQRTEAEVRMKIGPATGTFEGALTTRDIVIELALPGFEIGAATMNNEPTEHAAEDGFVRLAAVQHELIEPIEIVLQAKSP